MYSIIRRPDKSCDVFLNRTLLIGRWIGLVFYPSVDYPYGTPISLMRFLLKEGME